ncbi:hypothetical protein Drorol1_Dr00013113 [Drosera rotundifolia]
MFTLSLPSTATTVPPNLPPKPLKNPTIPHLRTRLRHQTKTLNLNGALNTLTLMSHHNITPDLIPISILLKSCIKTKNFHLGRLIHDQILQTHLELDTVLFNMLLDLYWKSGDWEMGFRVWDEMGEGKRDLVSWSSMINGLGRNGFAREAVAVFGEMVRVSGFKPNGICYVAVIRAAGEVRDVRIGERLMGNVIVNGWFDDVMVGSALIDMFAKGFGDLEAARKVFDGMSERDVVVWSGMIARLAQMGFGEEAVLMLIEMEESGCVPDLFTITSVVSGCAEMGDLRLGRQLHCRVAKLGWTGDSWAGCSLVNMYAKCGGSCDTVDDARKVFDRIMDPAVMSWTAMITAYVQSGDRDEEAIELFIDMIHGPVAPNHYTFASVLKACGNLSDSRSGEQVHAQAVKLGRVSDDGVGSSIISMYSQSGRLEDARKAFDAMFEKNLVSFNAIVDGYAKNLNPDTAFELFNRIESSGMGGNAFTFTSLLSGAASIGAGDKGELLHARIIKAGFESNLRVSNALISMYSRCGNMDAACRIFADMEEKNVVSWTSLITGYAKHGLAKRALEMFERMIGAGVKPNEITFVAVLSACSHVGLVSEGRKYFDSMQKEYGIAPRMEHYACMVDLLGRSGLIVEALDFINSMPFSANALVWRTLLGACSLHGNIVIGEQAAKMVMERDPNDPAAHTLLSNLYASKGQWDQVLNIRKHMKKENLNKEAGCSWIEVAGQVHKFYVGDALHPQAEQIYEELDTLVTRIKEMGYVPDTDFVLHEMEEEQKELYLLQHSEKIAVALGLISTTSSKPIRIFKNLRVCGDCHNAMKYISKATGREIVVRDSNRFHHFRDGSCSCNDYW